MEANNNNTSNEHNKMPGLTLNDLAAMIQRNATKDDIDNIITNRLNAHLKQTDEKIEVMQQQVDSVAVVSNNNTEKIDELQATVETLKQDQLKNNLCISGVPTEQINDINTSDIIIAIAKSLGIDLAFNHFTSYSVANKKFIIVHFFNYKHKQQLLMRIRARKSLMVEEVFKTKSNSQIYLNDHLTPYFNKLHLQARNAKKEGKLVSVTSYGGKIRVRKNASDIPVSIVNERQLQTLIDMELADTSSDSLQFADASDLSAPSTSTKLTTNASHKPNSYKPKKQNNNKHTTNTQKKSQKRRIENEGEEEATELTNDSAKKQSRKKHKTRDQKSPSGSNSNADGEHESGRQKNTKPRNTNTSAPSR